jgi:large subunit ribosomal protein L32
MGAEPKRKISKARKGRRRSHNALKVQGASVCPKCGRVKRSHFECSYCGTYKNKS